MALETTRMAGELKRDAKEKDSRDAGSAGAKL
jgi:hypothetical protein